MKVRLLVCSVLLLGCGGSDGNVPVTDFFGVDQEVVDTERASNDTDAPLNDTERGSDTDRAPNYTEPGEGAGSFTPGDPDSPPGNPPPGGVAECVQFCQRLGDAGCDLNACVSNCPTNACRQPLIRLGDCVIGLDRCPESVSAGDPLLNACSDEIEDYVECQEDGPPAPPSTPDPMLPSGCDVATGCDCANECDACRCAVDPGVAMMVCAQYCD